MQIELFDIVSTATLRVLCSYVLRSSKVDKAKKKEKEKLSKGTTSGNGGLIVRAGASSF
jgi:hypothetical protein